MQKKVTNIVNMQIRTRSRPRPNTRGIGSAPALLAAADCLVIAAYLIQLETINVQLFAIISKIAMFFLFGDYFQSLLKYSIQKISIMLGVLFFSVVFGQGETWTPILQLTAFTTNLMVSLAILRASQLLDYIKYSSVIIFITNITYLIYFYSGLVGDHYGRYLYFSDSHPNLGCEIAAVGAVTAAIVFKNIRLFFLFAGIALIPTILMQGRSAYLTVVVVSLIYGAFALKSKKGRQILTLVSPLILLAFAYLVPSFLEVLDLDSRQRGLGSGFTARSDRWDMALERFLENPLFGVGYYTHLDLGLATPHNFILYALSETGIFAIVIFAVLGTAYAQSFRADPRSSILLGSFIFLIIFNDRFFNLNPYPFIVFVMLFAFSAKGNSLKIAGHKKFRKSPAF